MNPATIMTKAAVLLQDVKHTRWPLLELAEWIDEGTKAIVMMKPAAGEKEITLDLAPGTRQTIPDDPSIVQLLDIIRNVAADNSPGRAVKRTARAELDAQDPNWHNPTHRPYKPEVRNFTFDGDAPREFFVYPGNNGSGRLDVRVAKIPETIVSRKPEDPTQLSQWEAVEILLPDFYGTALLDFLLYRAFSKEIPEAAPNRAMGHYQAFATTLGSQVQVETSTTPGGR